MVYNLSGLVSEGDRAKDWRRETLPPSGAVLFGADLRGLHARLCLESHWTGAGDTDIYRVALRYSVLSCQQSAVSKSASMGKYAQTHRNPQKYAETPKQIHLSNTPCLLYTSPSPRDRQKSRMPSSA